MSFGQTDLQTILKDSVPITSLLDTFQDKNLVAYPMIVFSNTYPSDWDRDSSGINYYRSTPVIGTINYGDYDYTINCRAFLESDAETISKAVYDELNRISVSSGVIFLASILQTLIPEDETDNYNSPVLVKIKTR